MVTISVRVEIDDRGATEDSPLNHLARVCGKTVCCIGVVVTAGGRIKGGVGLPA